MSERPLVIKFGGTSVGDGAAFARAANIVAGAAQNRPVAVVVSAMSGTTDTLLGYAEATAAENPRTATGATREGSIAELHRTLHERHTRAAREAISDEFLPQVEERISTLLRELAEAIVDPVDDPDARRARIAVYGERLSAEILAGAVSSAGTFASVVAGDPIATDHSYAEAEIQPARTRERCKKYVCPLLDEGLVAVVPGYVGRSPDEEPTTLGRGGSDLSATVVGWGIGASEAWIMSDVEGVLDADPRLVPGATLLSRLSYREAGVFAGLGAKVLHHRTMEPASAAEMEVWVRNSFKPDNPGTLVSSREGGDGVRCVALERGLSFDSLQDGADVFCVLGAEGPEVRVLARDRFGEVAAAVCVGRPGDGELVSGLRALREAGIECLWVGPAVPGLVFVVPVEEADEALRVLHGALVSGAVGSEVVV